MNDSDMLGTTLAGYAKSVVSEVVGLGRAGSLVDWEGEVEKRAYTSLYSAEQILNWRVERINGRNVPTVVVLSELVADEHPACIYLSRNWIKVKNSSRVRCSSRNFPNSAEVIVSPLCF